MSPKLSGSLDANVLLRLLLEDIPEQHEAVLRLFQDQEGQFEVADTAIIEVAFVLERHYGLTRPTIREAIDGLTSLTQIKSNQTLFAHALPLFVKHPKLSFEDCCLAAYAAIHHALPLWTFDQKLANQAPSAKLIG